MLIEKPQLDELLPHAGAMCLLDQVVSWDPARILCRTRSHRPLDNPLRGPLGLSALQGVEYGCQAMAIHSALLVGAASNRELRGHLVAVRDLVLNVDWLHEFEEHLDVTADLEINDGRFVVHRFKIEQSGILLLGGRLTVCRDRAGE